MISEEIKKIREYNGSNESDLEKLILEIGLNNEILHQQPPELYPYFGKGLKLWQYPNQLSKFGNFISNINVSSYMEIGCRFGGTFIFITELLLKNNKNLKTFACDIIDESEILKSYRQFNEFEYIQQYSTDPYFKNFCKQLKPEFVFIDGDHQYSGVINDYKIFEDIKETKYIVFHDITSDACPDVGVVWNEVKLCNKFNTYEFVDQYESVSGTYLGIGLAIRK